MEPDFEDLYAEELAALGDFDEHTGHSPFSKSKKSLDFSTPSTKQTISRLNCGQNGDTMNDSIAHVLEHSVTEEGRESTDNVSKTPKRRQDDLYGDLSDDDDNDVTNENANAGLPDSVPNAKRRRVGSHDTIKPGSQESTKYGSQTGEKSSQQMITNKPISSAPLPSLGVHGRHVTNTSRNRVHKRIPNGAFIPATSDEGNRFYMNLRSGETFNKQVSSLATHHSFQLLSVPLQVLRRQLDEQKRAAVLGEAQDITDHMSQKDDCEMLVTNTGSSQVAEAELWVEKYSPKCYTDLLSDEGTNRSLLHWLKQWDYVVFDKEKKPEKKGNKKEANKAMETAKPGGDNVAKKPFWVLEKEALEVLDDHDRPINKVALLHGPPGLGKTTLAHVLARHAGYNVVEMNASDDRTADVFQTKIESATQMKAVLSSDLRPNCLVIDEIDGAPQAAINVLLAAIKGEKTGKKRKGKREFSLLLRPIICICNDLFVPALRQLRSLAYVVHFPETKGPMLAGRLLEITKQEEIKTDLSTLLALCEKTDNDIRSCLNTLQFVRGQTRELKLNTVHSMGIGQKDAHKTLMAVCKHVFQMPKVKRKRYVNPYDRAESVEQAEELNRLMTQTNTSLSSRFDSTLHIATAAGEHEKVLQALHENFLEAKTKDTHMESVLQANEWACFSDLINQQVSGSQDYNLWRYLPYLPVAYHLLFAANVPPKLMYPKAQYELFVKLTRSENLLDTMFIDMAPAVRRNTNHVLCATELLPLLVDIIQPTLRPVNTQLYSSREKEDLRHLILVMVACNLTYQQQRQPDGQYLYTLDPNLDEVVRFPGQKPRRQFSYSSKQLVAREVELEKMRRNEGSREDAPSNLRSTPPADIEQAQQSTAQSDLPNYKRQMLKPKAVSQTDSRPDVDFFGRRVVKKAPQAGCREEVQKDMIKGDVWFRFKEGYTNAVRKTVRIQDFF